MGEKIVKVDRMRLIDKWAGVPLCLLCSLLNTCARFIRKRRPAAPVRSIAFVQLSEMGSAISAHSALQKCRVLFPGVRLYYVVFAEMQEAIRLLNVIPEENIIPIRAGSLRLLLLDSLRAVITVRRLGIDAVVDFELFSRVSSLLGFLFGCSIHAGFCGFHMEGLYRGSFHTHRVIYNHLQHISYNFLSLVYAVGAPAPGGGEPMTKQPRDSSDIMPARVESSDREKQRMFSRLKNCCPELSPDKKIVVLNPNGSELFPLRRWPIDNYIELIQRLLCDPDVCVVITGSHAEKTEAVLICDAVDNQRCINFVGQTSLRELLDLYAVSRLLITNDSGPPNFAALTDIPVLVFFGPEAPQCYLPVGSRIEALYSGYLCSPCVSAYNHRKSACTDNRCLQAITVDMVCERIAVRVPEIHMHRQH
jgi:ADP-heptose:LPS heptosyltransferase